MSSTAPIPVSTKSNLAVVRKNQGGNSPDTPKRQYKKRQSLEEFIQQKSPQEKEQARDFRQANFIKQTLNEDFRSGQMQNARKLIDINRAEQTRMQATFDEKRIQFELAKEEFDNVRIPYEALESDCVRQQSYIDTIVKLNETIPIHKHKDTVEAKTALDKLKTQSHVNWIEASMSVLKRVNMFLSPDQLWGELAQDEKIVNAANKNKIPFKWIKGVTLKSLYASAAKPVVNDNNGKRKKYLALYNEKIGLLDWVDDDGIPTDAKHMEQFVHAEG